MYQLEETNQKINYFLDDMFLDQNIQYNQDEIMDLYINQQQQLQLQNQLKFQQQSVNNFNNIRKLDVFLISSLNEKELIKNIDVQVTQDGQFNLSNVIIYLKQLGFSLINSMLFYYDEATQCFIYCGNDPIQSDYMIPFSNTLSIKFRKIENMPYIQQQAQDFSNTTSVQQKETYTSQDYYDQQEQQFQIKTEEDAKPKKIIQKKTSDDNTTVTAPKRIKERTISEVLEKVKLWRKMYHGYFDENNVYIQTSLKVAAQKIGISKKTLDDYLAQIKIGKQYGFDFKANINKKIGILRSFVKKNKSKKQLIKEEYSSSGDLNQSLSGDISDNQFQETKHFDSSIAQESNQMNHLLARKSFEIDNLLVL